MKLSRDYNFESTPRFIKNYEDDHWYPSLSFIGFQLEITFIKLKLIKE
jgi:hypothetical protein